jgi:hypothetical protein
MRLLELTINNFRGFGQNPEPLQLDSDLVLLFGPNGYGKSSIAESLEWLFYGSTKRRQLGDSYSKTEYAGTYSNIHRTSATEVSAKIRLSDNQEHVLTRRMDLRAPNEATTLLIDGEPGTFADLGVHPSEPVYPVVTQHSLQAFIHTRPKERRDAMGAALGLEEITSLKSALDGARRSFMVNPSSDVIAARARLRGFAPVLRTLPETLQLASRWNQTPAKVDVANDRASLVKAAQRLSGLSSSSEAELLEALREARRNAGKAVFDTTKLAPSETAQAVASQLSELVESSRQALNKVATDATLTASHTTSAYNTELLAFWEAGLRLQQAVGDQCPIPGRRTPQGYRREQSAALRHPRRSTNIGHSRRPGSRLNRLRFG